MGRKRRQGHGHRRGDVRGWPRPRQLPCVNVGRGIGSGIVIGGQIYGGGTGTCRELRPHDRGPQWAAMSLRQPRVPRSDGRGPAIAASAIRAVTSGVHVHQAACGRADRRHHGRAGVGGGPARRPLARQLIAEAGRYLGIGIANAVNLLGPEIVVIGGGVARAGRSLR